MSTTQEELIQDLKEVREAVGMAIIWVESEAPGFIERTALKEVQRAEEKIADAEDLIQRYISELREKLTC